MSFSAEPDDCDDSETPVCQARRRQKAVDRVTKTFHLHRLLAERRVDAEDRTRGENYLRMDNNANNCIVNSDEYASDASRSTGISVKRKPTVTGYTVKAKRKKLSGGECSGRESKTNSYIGGNGKGKSDRKERKKRQRNREKDLLGYRSDSSHGSIAGVARGGITHERVKIGTP